MITGNPPRYRWRLEKQDYHTWYSYYPHIVEQATADGWTAIEQIVKVAPDSGMMVIG